MSRGNTAPWLSTSLAAYRELLLAAHGAGYTITGLHEWARTPPPSGTRCLIVRHDVDQQPASALRMAAIEQELEVRSTWYFRWRTAHPRVVARIAATGAGIGLHYETLSRVALAEGIAHPSESLIAPCREILRREVAAFRARHGAADSISAHGDTRVPGVRNDLLVRGRDPSELGVAFDASELIRGRRLGARLTDRRGGSTWNDGLDPRSVLASGATPILALVHPNNWTSHLHAAVDRALRATLPDPHRLPRPLRSGSDEPPL